MDPEETGGMLQANARVAAYTSRDQLQYLCTLRNKGTRTLADLLLSS